MKPFISVIILSCMLHLTHAQNLRMNLYPEGKIPNSILSDEKEIIDTTAIISIRNVQVPDISIYLPSKKNRTDKAIIICPGGGYEVLAYDWEGDDIAMFWNSRGITAIVLKYRLPSMLSQIDPHKTPLMDAQRAMRLVRFHAEEWNISPNKIGIMGFSAGGHLASSLSTHFDYGNPSSNDPVERISCRPDFSLLIYPVITFTEESQHSGSRKALVGENKKLMKYYSSELQVKADTPPTILIHSSDDKSVPVENSILYYKTLLNNKIPAEMHIYPYGGHGFSLAIRKGYLSTWTDRCYDWLNNLESLK